MRVTPTSSVQVGTVQWTDEFQVTAYHTISGWYDPGYFTGSAEL